MKAGPIERTADFTIGTCPACKQDVTGTAHIEISVHLDAIEYAGSNSTVRVTGMPKFTGVSLQHDCTGSQGCA